MLASLDDFLRQMVKQNLRLVSYHGGLKKLDHAELQTMNVSALKKKSSAANGPTIVPLDVFNQMLKLKFIEERAGESDPSRSIFYLTEVGRVRSHRG